MYDKLKVVVADAATAPKIMIIFFLNEVQVTKERQFLTNSLK
jgi:hypothetical protein